MIVCMNVINDNSNYSKTVRRPLLLLAALAAAQNIFKDEVWYLLQTHVEFVLEAAVKSITIVALDCALFSRRSHTSRVRIIILRYIDLDIQNLAKYVA